MSILAAFHFFKRDSIQSNPQNPKPQTQSEREIEYWWIRNERRDECPAQFIQWRVDKSKTRRERYERWGIKMNQHIRGYKRCRTLQAEEVMSGGGGGGEDWICRRRVTEAVEQREETGADKREKEGLIVFVFSVLV